MNQGINLLLLTSGSGNKPTIRAGRRRPGGGTPPGGRQRDDAPERQPSGGTPPSGGGYTPSGGGLPGGLGGLPRSPLGIGLLVLLIICAVPLYLIFGRGGSSDVQDQTSQQGPLQTEEPVVSAPQATATRKPTARPATGAVSAGNKWLVMLYQDADDKILEKDIFLDLNEAERVGSTDQVQVVTQIDRFRAGFTGDGDWDSTKRFYVLPDDDLNSIGSQEMGDLGEANMSSGQTLVEFISWAVQNYPADKYALIMSDHGTGWPGGWSDSSASAGTSTGVPLTRVMGEQIYLNELDDALAQARSQSGIDKFELVGLDACLMGHLEVLSALEPHARFAVLSQEVEPALGWAYTSFLNALNQNPAMDGGELGKFIVDSYVQDDQRIVDDQARLDLVGRSSPMGSLFGSSGGPSAAEVANQLGQNITLAAYDLSALAGLTDSVNALANSLQEAEQRNVAQARSYAQSFTSIFGRDVPASYIDLGNFVQLVARTSGKRSIGEASNAVLSALQQVVLSERHGPQLPGATGISIYFPNSQLYRSPAAGPESYTAIARRFAEQSLWDEFLAFHYTGETFDLQTRAVSVPPASAIEPPAAGGIQVSAITLSSNIAAPGQPILLSADISGENIGYVKLLVGFLDRQNNSIYVADSDYLTSPQTKEIDGVYYPDWGSTTFTLEFEWEPIVFAISDGVNAASAVFNPISYGRTAEEAVYTVDGTYTFADGGERRHARLIFKNGVLEQVLGFTSESDSGAPREILPQPGDQFTVSEKWMDLDEQGNVKQYAQQDGETVTFGDQMFTWVELDAAAGDYIVGFIVEDLDGNAQVIYETVTVR